MKTAIYFIRHGEVFNPKGILYGRLPRFGLSVQGKKELAQTAAFLATQQIDYLYSSKQLRAKQSAQIIQAQLHLPLHLSNNLLEVKTSLQGRTFQYISTLNYDIFVHPDKKIVGETIQDVANRMQKFMLSVLKKHPGKKIVAVSHGDPIMLVKAQIEGLPIVNESIRPSDNTYVGHGEVYLVEREDNKSLTIQSIFKPN
ncbi:MAG TPA: histidine phosphatase family protein [Methylomirabilota bacterium]|nr:histidine phosphatase family protein [Methylomirabilota bacterium]